MIGAFSLFDRTHMRICLLAGLLAAGMTVEPARAQSLTAGALAGMVRDSSGQLVPDASVTLIDRVTGVRRTRQTPRDGRFRFTLLLPGDYSLLVERLGYRPQSLGPVPVWAGGELDVVVTLAAVGAGPEGADTVRFAGVPAGGVRLATGGGTATDDVVALADPLALVSAAAEALPGGAGDLAFEGLPGRRSALALDGLTRGAVRHPRRVGAELDATAFPLAGLRGVARLTGGADAEWPGGGNVLSGVTVPGSGAFRVSGAVLAGTDVQTGALLLTGPVVPDTAHFAVGVAASRYRPQLPAPWIDDTLGSRLVAIAQDSFQADLSAYARAFTPATMTLSAFGRFDWLVARDHRLGVRVNAGQATLDDEAGPGAPSLGTRLTARDLSVGVSLTSALGARGGSELRVGVDAGDQDHGRASLPGTIFADRGLRLGATSREPGTFSRSTLRFSETVHLQVRALTLKAGVQLAFATDRQTWAEERAGTWVFGDSTGLAARTGAFRQTVGSLPATTTKTRSAAAFLQALARPAPGLAVRVGVRFDGENRDAGQIPANADWFRLTGIANVAVPAAASLVSPRAAFDWALGAARTWQLSGEAGTYLEPSDPALLAEAIVRSGGTSVRRGFGALGAWPAVPDSTAAPVQGRALTLLGSHYLPPRTGRVQGALTGNLGGLIVHLSGTYRHTDYLPVRRDLNLAVNPRGRDADGRVVYGPLVKSGALVTASPGGYRRFSGFDEVIAVDPSASSDYWGVTVSIDREVERGLNLMVRYTYSRATDDWFGAGAGDAESQLVPFADSSGIAWTDGRSDFDVPHRLFLGGEVRLPGRAGVRLAALYRYRSGAPFTPGYRAGVDANADGSGRNDPAFVSDTLPGAAAAVAQHACLRGQIGRFAMRNSCRAPAVTALDLRLAVTLGRVGAGRAELIADVLGAVRGGTDLVDQALYLVDPAAALATSAATGVTTVPYVANPNFGQPLVRRDPGALWRLGLRVTY